VFKNEQKIEEENLNLFRKLKKKLGEKKEKMKTTTHLQRLKKKLLRSRQKKLRVSLKKNKDIQ